ncbi:MAG TPA: protein kinase [Actinomycetota bacterium]|nr:protein kinase [Actinomycetota bacterium]
MSSEGRDALSSAVDRSVAGRYVLEDLVARGGMGSVYRARDEVLARPVAVKILHPHLSQDESFLARFRREAVAAAGLSHPSIVAIYDTGADAAEDGARRHYIVMEHCAGGTLTQILAAEGTFAPDRAAHVGAAICSALDFAHRAGVVHRDVKPDNVLFSDDGTLKVADFGIAKAAYASGDITTTGSILGTVTYISPEQAEGSEPDARSDIYSVGVLLYELLAGRPPFRGETDVATAMMHLREAPAPVRALKPHVPRGLDAIVMKALAKDPAQRWGSAAELCSALEHGAGASGATVAIPRPSPAVEAAPPADTHRSDTRWIGPVVALIAFAALLAVVIPRLVEDDPAGRTRRSAGSGGAPGAAARLEVASVESFDPDGDGAEHSEEAPLAADGDEGTGWGSETYDDPLGLIKEGIGLVFDLGSAQEVSAIELVTSTPGFAFELRAGDGFPETADDLEVVARTEAAAAVDEHEFDPVRARYWLVWITRLPGDGTGTAEVEEVTFRGRS